MKICVIDDEQELCTALAGFMQRLSSDYEVFALSDSRRCCHMKITVDTHTIVSASPTPHFVPCDMCPMAMAPANTAIIPVIDRLNAVSMLCRCPNDSSRWDW